ncbi:MAG: beta-lactamase domain protein [Gemmatimonadetes bacterium]|nr:beta-lactamase domain protein [Gemmatimonadota bacterium]
MKLWVLGSGSGGNAVLIECGESRVLVDAGFAPRTLSARLQAIGIAPASIEACIVTHEHTDHVKGAAAGARRWGWALYASGGTMDACPELQEANCTRVDAGAPVRLSRMVATTFLIPHDAASPVGVRLACASTGAAAVVCTDVGHASEGVRALCAGADLLVLESNHDEGMLRAGPYPPSVQARIGSRTGHLSNRACADLARSVVHRDLAHVVLAHLSAHCNDHGLAHQTTADALRRARYRGALSVAMQHDVTGPFLPRAGRGAPEPQYSLGL